MQRKRPLHGKIFARCIPKQLFAGLFGCMARISCQSQPFFGCMACESCRELAIFPSEAPSEMHEAQNLPRIAARERIRAQSCHRQAPGNTSMKNLHNRHLTIVYKSLTRNQAEYNKEIGF